jgi:Tol biopolymer transport system component
MGIWTAAVDGSDSRLLVDSLDFPTNPRVAPDGHTVVFENRYTLYLTDAAGKNRRPLVTGLTYNYDASWTPDGAWILFVATDSLPGNWQLFRIRPTGQDREQLTSSSEHWVFYPTLSPDARQLAFIGVNWATSQQWVVVRDLVGGTERVVSDSTFTGQKPSWSPDGSTLLFIDADTVEPGFAFWRLDLGSLAYTYFGPSEGNQAARYSPNGQILLFGSGDLWLADSSGHNPRVLLADSTVHFSASWTPPAPP